VAATSSSISDTCEVMIKRVGEPYSRTLHDDEAKRARSCSLSMSWKTTIKNARLVRMHRRRRFRRRILGLRHSPSKCHVIRTCLSLYMMVIYTMLDISQIEGFEWDEGNSRKSVEKHDVSQAEAEQVFFSEPLLIVEDVSHSSDEIRLHGLGQTDAGRLLHISFTLRGKLIRVISARTMHRKERLRYEQEA
jgi:uncharacterized protein